METTDRSPAPKEECKGEDKKRREEDDVLVVDIDEGREKPTARRPAQGVVSPGRKIAGTPTVI